MGQQLRLIANQNGMLLLALIQAYHSLGNLAHQVAPRTGGRQVQFQRDLTHQVERRAGGEVYIEDLVLIGRQGAGEDARGGGLARADFAGQQSDTVVLRQKLQPRFDVIPGLRGKQLLGVGLSANGVFLKPKNVSHMV
jgi:hypothetical protein